MRPVKIFSDSCSDLSKDLREKYDIDYVRMKTIIDGKETDASLDWEFYSPKELYDHLRKGGRVLTAQVPQGEFERAFNEAVEQGCDAIYISCSVKQTSSVNTGALVAKAIMEKHPEAKIFCIDSFSACMAEGLVAIRAAELRDKGLDAQAIADEIVKVRKQANEFCTVHSLEYFKRAGRIKSSAAFFGNLLGVKPIVIADKNGNQTPLKKVKGRQTSINELVNLTKETIVNPEEQTVYIVHADCNEADLNYFIETVKREIPCKDVHVSNMGPIIGGTTGPDSLAIFCWGKEVTFEAE
ncbi:MAG: DegV family protein [Spirochaetales bacterium]|nr:DegV family protein [Spirochaetales bacterium]